MADFSHSYPEGNLPLISLKKRGGKLFHFLEKTQPVKLYRANELIYLQNETAERFYYIRNGRARIFLTSPEGAEKTLAIAQSGSLLGEASFFSGTLRVSSAKTIEKSEIISIERPVLLDCFQRFPELAMELFRYLSETIRMLSAQVDSMAFQQADQRLAGLLVQLSQDGFVHSTHEELSLLAGVSRVTVSRIVSFFAKKEWISTGYGRISILQPQALLYFSYDRQN